MLRLAVCSSSKITLGFSRDSSPRDPRPAMARIALALVLQQADPELTHGNPPRGPPGVETWACSLESNNKSRDSERGCSLSSSIMQGEQGKYRKFTGSFFWICVCVVLLHLQPGKGIHRNPKPAFAQGFRTPGVPARSPVTPFFWLK